MWWEWLFRTIEPGDCFPRGRNAIQSLGYSVRDVRSADDVETARVLVFPGVGSFGAAMDQLRKLGLDAPLRRCGI